MHRTTMSQIKHFAVGLTLLCIVTTASAQQQSVMEEVLAANAAFDSAISKLDLKAMTALWAKDERIVALHPRAKQLDTGWDAVRKSWEVTFDRFSELSVHMQKPVVRVNNGTAWVTGMEQVVGRRKNGDTVSYSAFTTNAFEKRDGAWLMTLHSTSIVPKE